MDQFEATHSTNIGWARYNEEKGQLEVDFKNKHGQKTNTYVYDSVPASLWEAFKDSPSKGLFFAEQIRPRYVGRKLGEPARPEAAPPKPGSLFG